MSQNMRDSFKDTSSIVYMRLIYWDPKGLGLGSANIQVTLNRLTEAESMYRTGIEVAKNVLGEDHDQTLIIQEFKYESSFYTNKDQ